MSVNDAVPRADASPTPNPAVGTDEGASQDEDAALSSDQVFHLLQNRRRREVLRYLRNADADCVRMRDVAEAIAADEHDTTVDALSSKQRQRVYVPLYQNHLPKLDADGVVDYDQSRGIVERKPAAAQLERHLWPSTVGGTSDTSTADAPDANTSQGRSRLSLAATAVAAVVVTGVAVDAPAFAPFPDAAAGLVALGLLAAVTVRSSAAGATAGTPSEKT